MLFPTSSSAKIEEPVTFFAICLRMLISFLNDVDIQLISEIKKNSGKYHPACPKNP